MTSNLRELAMFDLMIDSERRVCDRARLRVLDVCHRRHVASRAIVMQQQTRRPVQFEMPLGGFIQVSHDSCRIRVVHRPVRPISQ